ncbi:hypothetical protein [Mycoplasma todarodis]|uniref:Lipoprotein n=1 Tax=Mycoplasma todarodis TaxID=1937191 RepID=A0A4R0XQ83_9MOLU|nr:hypothetical protein [Mycoplasma todarodis]TCG11035.1 hypothetical protein C4B25_02470 [Mycoplasma todarodis]
MTLKRKLLLTTSTLLVAATPVATVISCGKTKSIDNNINDPINDQDVVIGVSNSNLIVSGKDGSGTFKFDVSPNLKKLLKDAGATYEYFIKRYKQGPKSKFMPINKTPYTDLDAKPAIKDLSIEDEIRVKITLKKSGFIFKNGSTFQRKVTDSEKDGLDVNWYKPATITKEADSMVTVKGDTLEVNLDKEVKTNELVFKMAKELGLLFADDPTRFVAKLADKVPNPITMKDICESLDLSSPKRTWIKRIIIKKIGQKDEVLNLEDMKNKMGGANINLKELIENGFKKLSPYKDIKLDDNKVAPESVFTSDATALRFAAVYGKVATPIKDELLTMIGAMKDDKAALGFIPKLAIGYGNIFKWMIGTNTFKSWVDEMRVRPADVNAIPNIFMATLFRSK